MDIKAAIPTTVEIAFRTHNDKVKEGFQVDSKADSNLTIAFKADEVLPFVDLLRMDHRITSNATIIKNILQPKRLKFRCGTKVMYLLRVMDSLVAMCPKAECLKIKIRMNILTLVSNLPWSVNFDGVSQSLHT